MKGFNAYPLGDSAITIEFGKTPSQQVLSKVKQFSQSLQLAKLAWIIEWTTAYTTVTIYCDIAKVNSIKKDNEDIFTFVIEKLSRIQSTIINDESILNKQIEIPVCYDDEFALDLEEVAKLSNLSKDDVIAFHTNAIYQVAMVGFLPGFPFLQGLPSQLTAPRKKTPRLKVLGGSVAVAGKQTGIYPSDSPGGWQIIGRTPLKFFRRHNANPSLLKAGDTVCFKRISKEQFYLLDKNQ
ncbi:hypothetical protein CIB95_01645 [Lottiidibacillus patelloidae]|uniref:Carboxyltransferase domain-containing protein n=1 Tax=Lottiidibacillus patelloidae TaxID=2670334 RepID=A0A263BX20_9BACI|nr:5-oxoprolinase subunit PxpB [Lottiidibacillus patelloidae]OZM58301.1 hypothetical protein CIB95_01645 [Lottiidibacillus patelloidae]